MAIPTSCCDVCRHRHFSNEMIDMEKEIFSSCDAYPDGIPLHISTDKFAFWPKWEDGIPVPDPDNQAKVGAPCLGIEGKNYLPMQDEDWEKFKTPTNTNASAVSMDSSKR